MGRYSSPVQLKAAQEARFARLGMSAQRGHEDLALQGLNDMIALTGGGLSSKTLRRMGHPYARKAKLGSGSGSMRARGSKVRTRVNGRIVRLKAPLLPINAQSRRLRRSLRMRRIPGGTQAFSVGPDKSAGRSINVLKPGGTKNMVDRLFWPEVKTRWKARNAAFIQTYLRDQRRP